MITSIGEFQISAELGRGGMGCVYRAHDPQMDREVAIKVLTSQGDPDLLGRFRSEAGTTAKLRHPNIVTVYAYDEEDGVPYLVMELLEGQDLGKVIREKRVLTLLDKVRIMHQVADGLYYAHQLKVVHRDIKPGNIMLLPDGTAKIMDFGIARVTGGNSTRRTQKGFLLGTIAYMAPEQFKAGKDADHLTDIFAFGDVLYELITGVHPFEAADPGTQIFRITTLEPTPMHELVPDCPEALGLIIQQLLSKDRDLRYQSLKDVVLDLEPVLFQLRQQRAEQILVEVHPLIQANNVEAALEKVKQALVVDPVNREAQKLRNELQQRAYALAVRAKVENLLGEADKLVSQRKFPEAMVLLENAYHIDKSDTVQSRLESVRGEQERLQRAVQLLGEARREVHKGNLPVADSKIREALEADPSNTEIVRLAQRIRESLERLERERKVREAIQASALRASSNDFEGALQILDEAGTSLGPDEELDRTRVSILGLKADFDWKQRQKRFEQSIADVRTELGAGRLADARTRLDQIAADFSDWPALEQETSPLRDDLRRREREVEVVRIQQRALGMIQQRQFAEARAELDDALRRLGEHKLLRQALEELIRAKAARDRAAAIARSKESIARLRQQDPEAAYQAAQSAQREFPEHEEFKTTVNDLRLELEALRREKQIAAAIVKASSLIEADPQQAAQILRRTRAQLGAHPDVDRLLAVADQAVREAEESRLVREILASAQMMRSEQKLPKALQEVERGIESLPHRRELAEAAAELRAEIERIARAEKLAAQTTEIDNAIARRAWRRAQGLIEAARTEFPGEAGIERLAEEVKRGRREDEFAALVSSVRQALSRDDTEGPRNLLSSAAANFQNEPGWPALLAEVTQRRKYLADLAEVRRLGAAGEFAEADKVARVAMVSPARDKRADELLGYLAAQRGKRFDASVAEARKLVEAGQPADARTALDRVSAEFSDWPAMPAVVAALREDLARREREAAILGVQQRTAPLIREGKFSEARAELDAAVRKWGEQPLLRQALDELKRAQAARERADAIARAKESIARLRPRDPELAYQTARKARLDFPEDSELAALLPELEESRRQRWIASAIEEATPLIESNPAQAAARLRETRGEFGAHAELDRLLAVAEQAAHEVEESQAVRAILEASQALRSRQQFNQALRELERGVASFPHRAELIQAAGEVRAELERIARAEKLAAQTRAIVDALARHDLAAGQALLDSTRAEFPGDTDIERLAEELNRIRREDEFAACASTVRQALWRDDIQGAGSLLERESAKFSSEAGWPALLSELDQRRTYLANLEEARKLGDASQFEAADRVLQTARSSPASDQRAEELGRTLAKKRQKLFDDRVSELRGLLQAGRLPDAKAGIDQLAADFAGWPGMPQQVSALVDELGRREREAEVVRIQQRNAALIREEKFAEARTELDEGLRRVGDHPALHQAYEQLQRAQAAHDRAAAIAGAKESVAVLRRQSLEQAYQTAQNAQRDFPEDVELKALLNELRLEMDEARRQKQIGDAIARATPLIQSDPAQAAALLRRTRTQYGVHAELERVLALAEVAAHEVEESAAVQEFLARARKIRSGQQPKKALLELERGAKTFPHRAELVEAIAELRADIERAEKAEKLAAYTQSIERTIARRDWKKSQTLIDAARLEFSNEPAIERLAEELNRGSRQDEFAALKSEVQQALARDDVRGAQNLLAAAASKFATDPGWPALQQDREQRRVYLNKLAEAQKLGDAGKFDAADRIAREALVNAGSDRRAEELVRNLGKQRARVEKETRDRELREAEARERTRKEQERKEAEARKERELREAQARDQAKREREQKEAAAREAARREQEQKDAAAREAARKEQELKDAAAREAARKEQERKDAAAREAARQEQERREAAAQEADARERERTKVFSVDAPDLAETKRFPIPVPAQNGGFTITPVQPETTGTPVPVRPPMRVHWGLVVAAAVVLAVIGYFIFRPSPATTPIAISANPTSLSFTYRTGSTDQPSGEISFNGGGVPFKADSTDKWLSVDPSSGSALSKLALHIDAANLKPASYDAQVKLNPSDARQSFQTVTIPVHLEVLPVETSGGNISLQVEPASMTFDYRDGDPLPAQKKLSVRGGSGQGLESSLANPRDSRWLAVTNAPGGFHVNIRPTGLTVGRHDAVVLISAAGTPAVRIPVRLNITSSSGPVGRSTQEQIRWRGELKAGETLTIQGSTASPGKVSDGELPASRFQVDSISLSGLAVENKPTASNRFTLRIRNRGSETVTSFTLFYHALQ